CDLVTLPGEPRELQTRVAQQALRTELYHARGGRERAVAFGCDTDVDGESRAPAGAQSERAERAERDGRTVVNDQRVATLEPAIRDGGVRGLIADFAPRDRQAVRGPGRHRPGLEGVSRLLRVAGADPVRLEERPR